VPREEAVAGSLRAGVPMHLGHLSRIGAFKALKAGEQCDADEFGKPGGSGLGHDILWRRTWRTRPFARSRRIPSSPRQRP
jgi:hypothetical protein